MKNVHQYITSDYKKIEGWFSRIALDLIVRIDEIQNFENVQGALCEVGVHHGRCFVLLAMLSRNNENCIAIDLFDNQNQNIDNSGCGDRDVLIDNLKIFGCDLNRVTILTRNSMDVTYQELLQYADNKYRFISLDGGHTSEIVQNDLKLAELSLCDGGLILLDDYFDEKWPGVSEGVLKYLIKEKSKLIPVAIFDDKILFTNNSNIAHKYKTEFEKLVPNYLVKQTDFFGESCLVIYSSSSKLKNYLRRTAVWQTIKNNKIGNKIRSMIKI